MISRVTGQYDRWVHMESNEPLIIKLQSHWKGYLARKAYKERQTFIKEHLPAIIKIQVRYFIKISFVRWQGFCSLIQLCYQVHVVRNHFLSNAIEISKKFCCDDLETIAAMGFNNSPENVFGEQAFLGSLRFLAISLLPYPFFPLIMCVFILL